MRGRKTTQTKVEQGRRRDKVRGEMQKGLCGGVFLETECRSVWLKLLKKHPRLRTGNGGTFKLPQCFFTVSWSLLWTGLTQWHCCVGRNSRITRKRYTCISHLPCELAGGSTSVMLTTTRGLAAGAVCFFCRLKCYKAFWKWIRGKGLNEQKILYLQQSRLGGL